MRARWGPANQHIALGISDLTALIQPAFPGQAVVASEMTRGGLAPPADPAASVHPRTRNVLRRPAFAGEGSGFASTSRAGATSAQGLLRSVGECHHWPSLHAQRVGGRRATRARGSPTRALRSHDGEPDRPAGARMVGPCESIRGADDGTDSPTNSTSAGRHPPARTGNDGRPPARSVSAATPYSVASGERPAAGDGGRARTVRGRRASLLGRRRWGARRPEDDPLRAQRGAQRLVHDQAK